MGDPDGEVRELERQWAALTQILHSIHVATADGSGSDLGQVLTTLTEEAARLTGADDAILFLVAGAGLRPEVVHGPSPALRGMPDSMTLDRGTVTGRAALDRRAVQVDDIQLDEEYAWSPALRGGFRATLAVPLLREEELLGVLTLFRTDDATFGPAQIELVSGFAGQAMIAVGNAQLLAELAARTAARDRTVRELEAMREVGWAVSASLDVDTVLQTVIQHAVRLSGAVGGAIGSIDAGAPAAADGVRLRAWHGVEDDVLALLRAHPVRMPAQAVEPGEPLEWADLTELSPLVLAHPALRALATHGHRSFLLVPLHVSGRVTGALGVWRGEAGGFGPEVAPLVTAFAAQSALAVQNAELFGELDRHGRELVGRIEGKDELYRLSTALQEPLSLREQLGRVLDTACRVVGIDRVYVWAVTADRRAFRNLAGAGFTEEEAASFEEISIPFDEAGVMHECYRRAQPILVDEAHPLSPELRIAPRFARLPGLRTRYPVLVPMVTHGRVAGVIAADNKTTGRPIGEGTVEMLRFFAASAAVAVENARLFAEISGQHRELEAANRHKSQFLANMSHELRTPLNAIIGYSEILAEEARDTGAEQFVPDLARVTSAGRHLLELINAVLDLSKIEAGRMELYLETVDVAALAADAVAAVEPVAAARRNELRLRCAADVATMRTDATKVTSALRSLLDNACKFTEDGTVTLSVDRVVEGGRDQVEFVVADTGIGMSREQLDGLFQEFAQADASSTRRYGGSGLGLALARRLCRLMDGDITVRSRRGAGSTFTMTVPAEVTAAGTAARRNGGPPPIGAGAVLVIDDDPVARDLLTRALVADGATVLTAAGGAEGLALARDAYPALITLDVLMPGMDGWAVLSALKADPELAGIPVILTTVTDDRNLGRALGAAEYLTKPVDRERLLAAVARHRRGDAAGLVLVVGPDPTDRTRICRALADGGIRTVEAADGPAAMAELAAREPALVVLDLTLPATPDVLAKLERRDGTRPIPVIVITAQDLGAAELRHLDGGVEYVVARNTGDQEQLVAKVRELVVHRLGLPDRSQGGPG